MGYVIRILIAILVVPVLFMVIASAFTAAPGTVYVKALVLGGLFIALLIALNYAFIGRASLEHKSRLHRKSRAP